jgi:hypothetical protein
LRGDDTIEEYDATSNTDSSDSDYELDGAGDNPPQAIVVRDRLRTTEELDEAKLHDDAQPFAQSKHSGRGKDGNEQGRKARRTTKTPGWPEDRDPPNMGDDVLVRAGNTGKQSTTWYNAKVVRVTSGATSQWSCTIRYVDDDTREFENIVLCDLRPPDPSVSDHAIGQRAVEQRQLADRANGGTLTNQGGHLLGGAAVSDNRRQVLAIAAELRKQKADEQCEQPAAKRAKPVEAKPLAAKALAAKAPAAKAPAAKAPKVAAKAAKAAAKAPKAAANAAKPAVVAAKEPAAAAAAKEPAAAAAKPVGAKAAKAAKASKGAKTAKPAAAVAKAAKPDSIADWSEGGPLDQPDQSDDESDVEDDLHTTECMIAQVFNQTDIMTSFETSVLKALTAKPEEKLTIEERHAKYRLERRGQFGRKAERAGRVAQLCGKANIEETVDDEEAFILHMCAKTPEAEKLRDVQEDAQLTAEDEVEADKIREIEKRLLHLQQFESLTVEFEYYYRSLCGEPATSRRLSDIVGEMAKLRDKPVEDMEQILRTGVECTDQWGMGLGPRASGSVHKSLKDAQRVASTAETCDDATRKISAAMADKVRPVIQAMVDAGTQLRRAVEDYAACVNVEDQAASKLVDEKQKLFDKAIRAAVIALDEKPVIIRGSKRVYQGSDWERKIFMVVLREEIEKQDGSM